MGSLLNASFSCTHSKPKPRKMKVFATLTTLLGASTATPLFLNQLPGSKDIRMNTHSMEPSMGISMESRMSHLDSSNRHMVMEGQTTIMRDMYRNNLDITSNIVDQKIRPNMIKQNMMGQEMRSNIRDMHREDQAFGPKQYFVKDDFGNYVYGYSDRQSEKSEEGNAQSIKGQYAYIMSNGVKRRGEYIADNNGFHVIRDNADPARIKRSTEPDLLQTSMTSVMDFSSLRDDASDKYRMSNMMGRDMTSNMDRNMMEQQRYSNMMGQDTMGRNIMGHDTMGRNMKVQDTMGSNVMGQDGIGRKMMGRNIYNIMSNKGMTSDVPNMMGEQMNSNKMGREMNMMRPNRMGQDRKSQMMGHNMLGHQEMTPNTMYSQMIGQNRMDMSNNMLSSRGMSSEMMNFYSNNGLMGQRMA